MVERNRRYLAELSAYTPSLNSCSYDFVMRRGARATKPLLRFSLADAAAPAGRGLPGFQGPLVFLPEVVFLEAVVAEVPGEELA